MSLGWRLSSGVGARMLGAWKGLPEQWGPERRRLGREGQATGGACGKA